MLSSSEFVKQSLALHLFFARIMKEHAIFLELGFTPKNKLLSQQADSLKMRIEALLSRAVALSNGVVDPSVLLSGEVFTPFTLNAENVTMNLTGVKINTKITQDEMQLTGSGRMENNPVLDQKVIALNDNAITLVSELLRFKKNILNEVLSCRLFTANYPLLLEHIIHEAEFYLEMIHMLQSREDINSDKLALENERFWNNIMAEHSKFIRGLLDPTEEALMMTANNFAMEFDQLTKEAKEAMDKTIPEKMVTDESLKATEQIKAFKVAGAQGILSCKIKSIIVPLLADHVLREANHYLRLLKGYEMEMPRKIDIL